ncbi:MORN repeat-containing protein [Turneriella parva]|uniref:MORN repeat-containing protein n=1 Tax=Turneriella parva (strain ATCC BAA-1111 / DSM 21527 / NCTC 11395 / H) TaxID=869212 RepID=I4BA21_TURPD|nr:MORN repeat-containing protein [Turneriella parva]AFM14128.1 MORN repeat-containing protein [Turneriella parva DSM 21527]
MNSPKLILTTMFLSLSCTSLVENAKKYTDEKVRCLRGNCYDGFGIQQTDDVEVYTGEFLNGKYHGKGEFKCLDKAWVKGTFINGRLVGSFEMGIWDFLIFGNTREGEYDGTIRITSTKHKKLDQYEINYDKGILHGPIIMSYDSGRTKMTINLRNGAFESGHASDAKGKVTKLKFLRVQDGTYERCYLSPEEDPKERFDAFDCFKDPFPKLIRGCNGI